MHRPHTDHGRSVFTSSVYAPAIDPVMHDFHASQTVAIVPFSMYVLGMAAGPMIASPCSESFGRKIIYICGLLGAAAFTIGAGFAKSVATLSICRFFAGAFFSPPMAVGGATLSDFWLPAQRAIPMSIYAGFAFLGPALGPILGGYTTAAYNWRWTQWVSLFFMAPAVILISCMSESHKPTILRRQALRGRPVGSSYHLPGLETCRKFITTVLGRPLRLLFTDPVVTAFALYIGFNWGVMYTFFAAFPWVFTSVYGLSLAASNLTFLGLAVGLVVGTAGLIIINKLIYLRKLAATRRMKGASAKLPPEERLYGAMFGGPCIAIALFLFGWTARPSVSFYVPIVAEGFFGVGNILVFSSSSQYMMDAYGPALGASAMAGVTLVRYLIATALPLCARQMLQTLGVGWGSSLLGFISVALALIPWLLFRFGPVMRSSGTKT